MNLTTDTTTTLTYDGTFNPSTDEQWRDCNIEGCNVHYEISNRGRCRSVWKNGIYYLTPQKINKQGYYAYHISGFPDRRWGKMLLVHKLVASAFLWNPFHLSEVNHIDGDKSNCDVSNLEWVDHASNVKHSYTLSTRGNKCIPVYCVETGKTYPSTKSVEDDGFTHSTFITKAIRTGSTAYGYHWMYANQK